MVEEERPENYLRRIHLLEDLAGRDHNKILDLEEKMESLQNLNKNHLGLTTNNGDTFDYKVGSLHRGMKIPTDRAVILAGYLDEKERYPIKTLEEIYSASALSVREKMYMAFVCAIYSVQAGQEWKLFDACDLEEL